PGTSTLRVHDLDVAIDDVLVNPWSALASRRFDPLDAGRLRLQNLSVRLVDLQAYVASLKRFRRSTVTADHGALPVTVRQAGPEVSARVRIVPTAGRPFAIQAESVRVAGLRLPDALVNWVVRNFDPTPRIASRLPFPVEIGRVSVRDDALRVSADR